MGWLTTFYALKTRWWWWYSVFGKVNTKGFLKNVCCVCDSLDNRNCIQVNDDKIHSSSQCLRKCKQQRKVKSKIQRKCEIQHKVDHYTSVIDDESIPFQFASSCVWPISWITYPNILFGTFIKMSKVQK